MERWEDGFEVKEVIEYGFLHLLPIKCCNILTSRIYYYKMLVVRLESGKGEPDDGGQMTDDRGQKSEPQPPSLKLHLAREVRGLKKDYHPS